MSTNQSDSLEGEVIQKPFGRPTKLTPEVVTLAWDYINQTGNINAYELLPTIEGLAEALDITRETLYKWEENNDDFSDIIKRLRQKQAQKLIQNSLTNKYNPMISKLLLSKHGYVEKTQQDTTLNVVQPIISIEESSGVHRDDSNQED